MENYSEFTQVADKIMALKEELYKLKQQGLSEKKLAQKIKFPKIQ